VYFYTRQNSIKFKLLYLTTIRTVMHVQFVGEFGSGVEVYVVDWCTDTSDLRHFGPKTFGHFGTNEKI